jgi:uncharacterized membrane protein
MSSDADIKMETAIGNMLRIGVSAAAAVVLAGWLLYVVHARATVPDYRHFQGEPISPRRVGAILQQALALDSRSIIEFGILLLVATPVARVVLCVFDFSIQKDKLFVLISGTVLAVLVYSLFFRT